MFEWDNCRAARRADIDTLKRRFSDEAGASAKLGFNGARKSRLGARHSGRFSVAFKLARVSLSGLNKQIVKVVAGRTIKRRNWRRIL